MADIIEYSRLENITTQAIQSALESSGCVKDIKAIALCVDDDISSGYLTVFKSGDDPETANEPVSWAGLPPENLEPVWSYLAERAEKQWDDEYCDYYEANIEKSFLSLVAAVKTVKNNLLGDSVLALVCGSDPSLDMNNRQAKALKQLNTETVLGHWGR